MPYYELLIRSFPYGPGQAITAYKGNIVYLEGADVDRAVRFGAIDGSNPITPPGGGGAPVADPVRSIVYTHDGILETFSSEGGWDSLEMERGVELGYAETAVNAVSVGTAYTDIPGLVVNAVVRDRPVVVELDLGVAVLVTADCSITIEIYDVTSGKAIAQAGESLTSSEGFLHPGFQLKRRYAPAPGARSWKARIKVDAGVATFYNHDVTGGVEAPSSLQVVEV